jgi:hypothetical protein
MIIIQQLKYMEINAMMDLLKGLRGHQKMKSHFAKEIF